LALSGLVVGGRLGHLDRPAGGTPIAPSVSTGA